MDPTVEREVIVTAAPGRVWEQLTDPDHLRRWLAPEVEFDPRPGGRVHVRWADGAVREGAVERVDPRREVVFRWGGPGGPAASEVTFRITAVPEGTRLVVTERGLTPTLAGALATGLGWSLLGRRLARGLLQPAGGPPAGRG